MQLIPKASWFKAAVNAMSKFKENIRIIFLMLQNVSV